MEIVSMGMLCFPFVSRTFPGQGEQIYIYIHPYENHREDFTQVLPCKTMSSIQLTYRILDNLWAAPSLRKKQISLTKVNCLYILGGGGGKQSLVMSLPPPAKVVCLKLLQEETGPTPWYLFLRSPSHNLKLSMNPVGRGACAPPPL